MQELLLHSILFKVIFIIIINVLSYKILNYHMLENKNLYQYKIKSFRLNILTCLFAFTLYFILLFAVRLYSLNKETNLILLIEKCLAILIPLTFVNICLLFIFFVSSIILYFFIFKEIQAFFVKQIKKCYIYTLFGTHLGSLFCQDIYNISLDCFCNYVVLLIKTFAFNLNCEDYLKNKGEKPFSILSKICNFIITKTPTVLIILYFIYEIKYNNCILSIKFKSWLFMYILFKIYAKITTYINYSSSTINEMVFNMYYRDRSIKYVNMPAVWVNVVLNYVHNGLGWTEKEALLFEDTIGILNFFEGMYWKYTWRSKDGLHYVNNNDEEFFEENNCSVDLVHYPYKDNDTFFNKDIKNDKMKYGTKSTKKIGGKDDEPL